MMSRPLSMLALAVLGLMATTCGKGGGNKVTGPPKPFNCGVVLVANVPFDAPLPFDSGRALAQLKQDATTLYWYQWDRTNGGAICSVPKLGGAVTTIVSGRLAVSSFLVDDTSVYWTEYSYYQGYGWVRRAPKAGGPVETLTTDSMVTFYPGGLTADATELYWSQGDGGYTVWHMPKTGGAPQTIGSGFYGSEMILDGTDFYAVGGPEAPGVPGNSSGTMQRMPRAGGAAVMLEDTLGSISCLASDNNYLYSVVTAAAPKGGVFREPKAGGPAEFLWRHPTSCCMHSVVSDGTYLYFADPQSGIVYRKPLAGGPETAIVGQGCRAPWFLAVDADYLYFTDDGNNGPNGPGSIVRVAKQ